MYQQHFRDHHSSQWITYWCSKTISTGCITDGVWWDKPAINTRRDSDDARKFWSHMFCTITVLGFRMKCMGCGWDTEIFQTGCFIMGTNQKSNFPTWAQDKQQKLFKSNAFDPSQLRSDLVLTIEMGISIDKVLDMNSENLKMMEPWQCLKIFSKIQKAILYW